MGCLHMDCYKAPFLFGVIVKRVRNTRLDPAAASLLSGLKHGP